MIRIELLGGRRRWSPWSKALLAALVVCGGLYGIHQHFPALAGSLFSAGSAFIPAMQQETKPSPVVQLEAQQDTAPSPLQEATSSPVVQREITPDLVAQQDTVPSTALVQQEVEPEPMARQDTVSSPAVQQESTPEPGAEQETTPKPVVVQRDTIPSSGMQQEATPSPVQGIESKPATQQDTLPSPVAQRDTVPSPATQQVSSPSPAREVEPKPVVQPEASTPAPAPPRSTVCHQVMRIGEQVPVGIRLASLNCNSTGAYWLEGTSPSHKVLREFRLRLQALPLRVSFRTWQEGRAVRFTFQGHFAEQDTPPLAALSSGQAEQFFGKVARWADASGLDSLSVHKPIHRALSPVRTHQRQKLLGIGSPQQIDAFLKELQQAEAVATLGEVLLMPVQSDERGWVRARLYAAVDIIVDAP